MPYKSEKIIIAHTKHDRRIKLTDQDKKDIVKLHKNGMGIRAIARKFEVDKRSIQFILFPERHERNLDLRRKRGGTSIYYDIDKQELFLKGEIKRK